eukprot:307028-Prymnesium_polylepis.1
MRARTPPRSAACRSLRQSSTATASRSRTTTGSRRPAVCQSRPRAGRRRWCPPAGPWSCRPPGRSGSARCPPPS